MIRAVTRSSKNTECPDPWLMVPANGPMRQNNSTVVKVKKAWLKTFYKEGLVDLAQQDWLELAWGANNLYSSIG